VPADLASIAAAQSAGYALVRGDRGANGGATRYTTLLEKRVTGDAGDGAPFRAFGEGASAGAADTVALNALNSQRRHRYGADATNVNKGPRSGATLTTDAL
jgi:hypothetical protein